VSTATHDVIVVGGGFAGVTTAREAARDGLSVVLLEARDRLGGRTWTAPWLGHDIEYGGGWVHWHQPHTFSEITRAGLTVELSGDPDATAWYVGEERRTGTIAERDAIANDGWTRFVEGVEESLPNPHDPLHAIDRLAPLDALTIAERVDQLGLDDEHRDVLWAELESLAHGPLDDAGAVSVLRWHALSGYSLALTQYTGGRVTLTTGTRGLLEAIASQAPFETRLSTPVAAVRRRGDGVEVETRAGEVVRARRAVVAVPLNTLGAIEFEPALSEGKRAGIALGQASRGIKIFIRAQGDPVAQNAIRPGHPFGYLDTEIRDGDGTQIMIGFGYDAAICDAGDLPGVQAAMDRIIPGYQVLAAAAHDWLADEFSQGTWAIHRPGWYTRHYAEMRRPEGRVLLAGSDLAAGWAGFIDGAIESGLRAGAWLRGQPV
jgi:monoamine oxidase